MKHRWMKFAGITLVGLGMTSVCFGTNVPEIDAGSGASAIAMLAGVLLVVRSRRS